MTKIIAFSGYKLNGKTTASNYLMERIHSESKTPVKVERINFKDCLVDEIKENFPGTLEFIGVVYGKPENSVSSHKIPMSIDDLFKEKPGGMRKLMQDVGLSRRKEDPMYWVDRWEKKVKESNSDVIITDDVRFMNEYDAIGRHGGQVYKIIREGLENTDTHATETEIAFIPCPEIRAKNTDELFKAIYAIKL